MSINWKIMLLSCKLFASTTGVHFMQELRDVVCDRAKQLFYILLLNFRIGVGPNPSQQCGDKV